MMNSTRVISEQITETDQDGFYKSGIYRVVETASDRLGQGLVYPHDGLGLPMGLIALASYKVAKLVSGGYKINQLSGSKILNRGKRRLQWVNSQSSIIQKLKKSLEKF